MPNISDIIGPQSIATLNDLATLLYERHFNRDSLVIPVIGAGGSASAGIPVGQELMRDIRAAFSGAASNENDIINNILIYEAKELFSKKITNNIDGLSFFQFASLFSKFSYGKQIINDVVTRRVSNPDRKPLCYEILAHFAKHRFVDHFISVNFDELLDESLLDEMPNRLRKIVGSDDLPGPNFYAHKNHPCYLLKPFGSFEKNIYKLRPEELLQFGSDSIWKFFIDKICNQAENGDPPKSFVLILVGYAAAEQAFTRLVEELSEKSSKVYVYSNSRPNFNLLKTLTMWKRPFVNFYQHQLYNQLKIHYKKIHTMSFFT